MEIAQAESGSFRGERGSLDLSTLATGLGGSYGDLAEDRGGSLWLRLEHALRVIGSRHLLAQAIRNLLDRALKFFPPGMPI